MNTNHNSTQRQLFLKNYAEIIPIVFNLRNQGCSLSEIANELNSRGFLTREKKSFSHVQVLRILQRVNDTNSIQNIIVESQEKSEVKQLKNEIYEIKRQYEELQIELNRIKLQFTEFKHENQLRKNDSVKLTSVQSRSVQAVQKNQIEPAWQSKKTTRPLDNEIKKVALQQANGMHSENNELSKSDIAKVLSEKFNVRFETARDWLKKLW
jgi:hypothetical protein